MSSDEAFSSCFVQGRKNTPPHYVNVLGDFTLLGTGMAFNLEGQGYSTQNLASWPDDIVPFVFGIKSIGPYKFLFPALRRD